MFGRIGLVVLAVSGLSACATGGAAPESTSQSTVGSQGNPSARPVPSVSAARKLIASGVAVKAGKIGSSFIGGPQPIAKAEISGPIAYKDPLSGYESDVYCIKFTVVRGFIGTDLPISAFAYLRQVGTTLTANVRNSSGSINLAGCALNYTPFPELESFNAVRAQRWPGIFGAL